MDGISPPGVPQWMRVIDWLGFYNARRLRSTLDYVSPMTFEKNRCAAQQGEAA
ncbi:hypothetical protein PTKU15_84090 [Paraburkholderia terrae]|nr:hypothetical protein PTKU15_84090 [Paraburkholderia terrae]